MAMQGALEVAECQYRVLHETWDQLFASGQNLLDGGISSDTVAAQAKSVKLASERFLADTQAFSSLVAKTNSGVSAVVRERLVEMMEEIGQLASQAKP
jgi:phasin family protein